MKLDVRLASSGNVEIDWGSGYTMKYAAAANSTTIQGVLSGEIIKIYAKNLTFLSCADLDLSSIDVCRASELQQLYCEKNDLTELDITCNIKLVRLGAHTNKLKDLDLSKNPKLTGLYLQQNQFDSRALNRMYEAVPKLKTKPSNINFRVAKNPGAGGSNTQIVSDKNWNIDTEGDNSGGQPIILTTQKQVGEEITLELRLSVAGNIEIDWGKGNQLVNVSTETTRVKGKLETGKSIKIYGDNIVFVKCEKEKLINIDVAGAKQLQQLYVGHNELTTVNVTQNNNLTRIGCNNNLIKELDLSHNNKLSGMYLQNNKMEACDLDKLFEQIAARPSLSDNVNFRITGNPGATGSKTSIAVAKNWNIDTNGDGKGCK